MNFPEQKALAVMRKFRQLGFPIRRQHPIGGYVVNFACIPAKLVVEIDGNVQDEAHVADRDAERQDYIEQLGWWVVRVDTHTAKKRRSPSFANC